MSTSTKRSREKELPIYDPEGFDLEKDVSYEEVVVPLQDHVTSTRRAMQYTYSSVQEAWNRTTEDARSSLTSATGKARKEANATLSSLGVQDSTLVVRGMAYAGAALTGLYIARRRSLFLKMFYPLLGAGLVGGAFHRHKLYNWYQNTLGGDGSHGNWLSWHPRAGNDSDIMSRWRQSKREGEREK